MAGVSQPCFLNREMRGSGIKRMADIYGNNIIAQSWHIPNNDYIILFKIPQ